LQSSMDEINLLEKLLPICANCKRIREDDGGWSSVDAYFSNHSDARFSKSICPKCEAEETKSGNDFL
ncbi:MAG: response regulator, partial [Candidatus Komeilibacteria bacterium CG_4_9_14_0_8_um_filter_36_9]